MPRAVITDEVFDRLVQAFRESPGNIEHARRAAQCGRKLAERAWEKGWPNFRNGVSVQDIFREEQQAARAKLLAEAAAKTAMAEKEREEARKQAIEARKQEGQLVTMARQSCLQAMVVVGTCITAGKTLAMSLKKHIDEEAKKPDTIPDPHDPTKTIPNPYRLPMSQAIYMLGRIADITGRLNAAAHLAMQMERLHLGQPNEIIGITTGKEDITLEEAELRIRAAEQALVDAKNVANGGLRVITGGLALEQSS
jgi:hypothetical protein